MKKFLLLVGLLVSCTVFADPKESLQLRLDNIKDFSAQFTQEVTTADHQLIQRGKGQLSVVRPNLFNWTIEEPDVTSIISNGEDMWIYTPAVEQVSIMSLNKAVDNRLLLLIADNHSPMWDNYHIERTKNSYTLKSTDGSDQDFIITVLPTGVIADFTIIDKDGQRSFYDLSYQGLGTVDDNQIFQFTPPKGVTIDDQR